MKQYTLLISALALSACGGGSGGGDGNGLTPAEHLFGTGIGTGATPSHLIPREDGTGFEILSFGAWGNVYDIKETSNRITLKDSWGMYDNHIWIQSRQNSTIYDFTGQQNLEVEQWRYAKDASVSNATFTGPALMYQGTQSYGDTWTADASDYGTVKIQFGYDIDNPPSIEFVMSNPENNLTTSTATINFSEDRNDAYIWTVVREDNNFNNFKAYKGYGHKN